MIPEVGSLVRLKVPCLGNDAGAIGICYEVYELGGRHGFSFIFENGNYDGFSPDEVERFLSEIGYYHLLYEFKNVIQLSQDFNRGCFDEALATGKLINRAGM